MSEKKAEQVIIKYRIRIMSEAGISAIAHPQNCKVLKQTPTEVEIGKIQDSLADLKKDVNVYFKTKDMD